MSELYLQKIFPFIILFSAVIGAYSTTAEYRIRNDLPLVTKDCFCPSCGHALSVLHQIPIISWLLLRGRCHYCQSPIPVRYPLTEGAFVLCYSTVFLIFQNHPIACIASWFLFITIFLLLRSDGHLKGLLRALGIMYIYHGLFSLIFLAVTEASKTL